MFNSIALFENKKNAPLVTNKQYMTSSKGHIIIYYYIYDLWSSQDSMYILFLECTLTDRSSEGKRSTSQHEKE